MITFSKFPTGSFLGNPTVTIPYNIKKNPENPSWLMVVTDTSTTTQHVTLFHKDAEDAA